METYIILFNYTPQGMAAIKESPARIEAARQAIEGAGGRMVAWYLTLGRYDGLVIAQMPNAMTATTVLLATGMLGNVRTESLRAFTEEEFKSIAGRLP